MRRPIVLFDVMGTLVYDPFYREVPRFFEMSFEELLAAKHPTAWSRFESGEIDERAMLEGFFRDGRAVPPGLREFMASHYRWLEGMRELVAELDRSGFALHVHSNYPDWYREIEASLRLSEHLSWTFVSCHTGLRKPDPRCYEHAARELGVSEGECLFIDDRRENCVAARSTGMDAIHFRDAAQLRAELRERGLLT